MVKVTFDYGNLEDHKLVGQMIGGVEAVEAPKPEPKRTCAPPVEQPKPPAPDTPAPEPEPVAEPEGKVLTAAEVLPKLSAHFQDHPDQVPVAQGKLSDLGATHINDLSPEQLAAFVAEIGVEV